MMSSESEQEFFHGLMQIDVHLAKAGKNSRKDSKKSKKETKYIEKHQSYLIKLDLQDTRLKKMKNRKDRKV